MSKASYRHIDNMHGLNTYDYGARQHYPVLGRWDRIDPLAEKYYSVSPYNYCMNNPVKFIDPDGKDPDNYYFNTEGQQVKYEKNNQADRFFVQNANNDKQQYSEISLDSEIGTLARIIYAEAGGENAKSKECVRFN